MYDLRPLTADDLPAAVAIQGTVYRPLYHEDAEVLGSRIAVAPGCCWGAFGDQGLAAYILSHPWPRGAPPAIAVALTPPPPTDNWFIHDLALSEPARGKGLGRALVARAADSAKAMGLTQGDLVAVQGAWSFWAGLGYQPQDDLPPALAAKVAAYGDDARYMTARLDELRL